MSTSISSISNQLESANHLAKCEETQALGHYDTSSYRLLSVDASNLLENARRVRVGGGLLRWVEKGARVSYTLDESLKV